MTQAPRKPIILLDLNFTLVANSETTFHYKFGPDVERETYRQWLVDLIRDHYVILITARTDNYQEATLESIRQKLDGWQPDEVYFKPYADRFRLKAHQFKQQALTQHIIPRHGNRAARYLALESNTQTRAMYNAHNIQAIPVPKKKKDCWTRLPIVHTSPDLTTGAQLSLF